MLACHARLTAAATVRVARSAQPPAWDGEPGAEHEMHVQDGRVGEPSGRDDIPRSSLREGDAASSGRRRSGAVDEGRWVLLPPVVHSVRQPPTGIQQGVRIRSGAEIDPTGADAVVEAEGVEVRLMSEVQYRRD